MSRSILVNRRMFAGAFIVLGCILLATWSGRIFFLPENLSISGLGQSGEVNAANDDGPVEIGQSGLPVPRFVSLKSDRVNVRVGPSQDHAIAWVFKRQGLPVEIVAEYENWRQIRDSDGAEGWVIHSLLSGRRTALIAPWASESASPVPLRKTPDEASEITALLEQNVLASLLKCESDWCLVHVQDIEGWLPQNLLWGVGPNETLK